MNTNLSKLQGLREIFRDTAREGHAKTEVSKFLSKGVIALGMLGAPLSHAQDATTATNAPAPMAPATNPASSTVPSASSDASAVDNSPPSLAKATTLSREGKQDEAINTVNAVLQADPKNLNAYVLRGGIYSQKSAWDLAQKDFETALQMDTTNDGVRYDLADLKFKQKQFDEARLAFVPLQDSKGIDDDAKDLIQYKIFICDLLGGHEDVASKELDAFNKAGSHPSYYFSNAAWDLVHKKTEDARGWLLSATNIYPMRKHLLYAAILKETGYLPLPAAPGDAK